jgi:cytoskeletal protein CcmA (bactofilin family)
MAKGTEEFDSTAINLLGAGTTITGDINSNGDIRINGVLTGNLSTKGRVIIGDTGKIKGDIICKNADILGLVEGCLTVSDLLTLKTTANVTGEVTIGKIAIEPGCKFNGSCKMTDLPNTPENRFDKKTDGK